MFHRSCDFFHPLVVESWLRPWRRCFPAPDDAEKIKKQRPMHARMCVCVCVSVGELFGHSFGSIRERKQRLDRAGAVQCNWKSFWIVTCDSSGVHTREKLTELSLLQFRSMSRLWTDEQRWWGSETGTAARHDWSSFAAVSGRLYHPGPADSIITFSFQIDDDVGTQFQFPILEEKWGEIFPWISLHIVCEKLVVPSTIHARSLTHGLVHRNCELR